MNEEPMPWFRFYHEASSDVKFGRIARELQIDKIAVHGAWTLILCAAAKSPIRGALYVTEMERYSNGDVSDLLGVSPEMAERITAAFKRYEMIEFRDGAIYIQNWDKRQYKSDTSAERVAKHREMKRYSNVSVTPPESDTESESEKESEAESSASSAQKTEAAQVFQVYEAEIGPITEKISAEIGAALEDYPADWLTAAFQEAAVHNARSWAYCLAILKRRKAGASLPARKNGGKPVDYSRGVPVYAEADIPDPPPETESLPAQLWANISAQLKTEMPKAAYDKYVSGVSPGPIEGDVVTLIAESPESRAWLKSRLTSSLQRVYAGFLARQVEIEYEV